MSGKPQAAEQIDDIARAVNESVGKRIKMIRVTNGHSQETLGKVLGLTFQQVQKYERGSNKISADKLWRVAQSYNVELEYFFQDIDPGLMHSTSKLEVGKQGRAPHERLRLEIGREARRLSPRILRAVLNVMRAASGAPDSTPADAD
ncbi:MAG TPA: helix-turn-helix transcriptional regulator [Aliidongia sp.]|nr:helix-turn-helix transcriptional regulator [Aliidongia sp.]